MFRRPSPSIVRLMRLALCLASATWAWALDFATLERIVHSDQGNSIESVLAALPASDRSRYVLVFDSRSLQGASPAAPRVLLYNAGARFIVSFNGEASQRGYSVLETMEFDPVRKAFLYREITFPVTQAESGETQRISPPNPPKCMTCHGDPAHPIWDAFPRWPGVYGEHYLHAASPVEADGAHQLLSGWSTHPRYRYLVDLDRYLESLDSASDATRRYAGNHQEPPNALLTRSLAELNDSFIVDQLSKRPAFDGYAYALLASLEPTCGDIGDLIPGSLRARFGVTFDEAQAKAARRNELARHEITLRMHDAHPDYGAAQIDQTLNRFRYLAEQGLGATTSTWTMALEKDTYDFSTLDPAADGMERAMLTRLTPHHPDLLELRRQSRLSGTARYCSTLTHLSRDALGRLQASGSPIAAAIPAPQSGALSTLVDLCIGCHQGGAVGPDVPFANSAKLATALDHPGYAHGTLRGEVLFRLSRDAGAHAMPLGYPLTDEQRRLLVDYFTTLGPANTQAAIRH